MKSRIRRQRVVRLESLETRKVFSATVWQTADSPAEDHVTAEIDSPDNLSVGTSPSSLIVAETKNTVDAPFRIQLKSHQVTIRAVHADKLIVVSKLGRRQLQILATNLDGSQRYTETTSARRIRTIKFLGSNGDDHFRNDTNIKTVALGYNGDDVIYGGFGRDNLDGGLGDDTLYGRGGNDKLGGQDGFDTLYGGAGKDELRGGAEDDELYGEDGRDFLSGGAGNDYLNGGRGNDRLFGDRGDDALFGGKGRDCFYYEPGVDALLDVSKKDKLIRV